MRFRERDGACVQYEVRGIAGSAAFPYINDLPSIKAAVAIARTYPGVYRDGSATHVLRRYSKLLPEGGEFHHSSAITHRWRVYADGTLIPDTLYSRPWPTKRVDSRSYARSLAPMPYCAPDLRGQLYDLAAVAEALGLRDAATALHQHLTGQRQLIARP
jgi:hypothetical protein